MERAQGVGAAAGGGQGSHQEASRSVSKRVVGDVGLEGGDDRRPFVIFEHQARQVFDGAGTQLGQASRFDQRPLFAGEFAVRAPPRQGQRLLEESSGRGGVGRRRGGHTAFELPGIDGVGLQLVAGRDADQGGKAECPAEPTDRYPQRPGVISRMSVKESADTTAPVLARR